MGKADLHVHTTYSDGTGTVAAVLEWAANFTGLDAVAITDHDTLDGAYEALDQAEKFGIQVIPGCEITTREGHLLALFIYHPVPRGLSMLESVLRVAEQGGLCAPAHPTDFLSHGASRETIWKVLQHADARRAFIGLETMNTGIINPWANARAQRIAREFNLTALGGSDSHVFWTVGSGYTAYEGHTPADLRSALLARKTSGMRTAPRRPAAYWPRHLVSFLLRKAGWVTSFTETNASFRLRRLGDI